MLADRCAGASGHFRRGHGQGLVMAPAPVAAGELAREVLGLARGVELAPAVVLVQELARADAEAKPSVPAPARLVEDVVLAAGWIAALKLWSACLGPRPYQPGLP